MKLNSPPDHTWLETADGSYTLFSEAFQEACHSTSGAKEETLLHYIQGTQIMEQIHSRQELSILEVGFGLGIGFLTTFEVLKETQLPWSFLSLELDENLLEWFRQENLGHPFLKKLRWQNIHGLKILQAQDSLIDLKILCADARQALPELVKHSPQQWHAIYQDAFSPKKNPTLWTVQWFELLKQHAHPEVILSTYSSSTSIRKSLIEAGWKLHPGEKFGPKKSSTRATLTGQTNPDILLHLERSPTLSLKD